MDQCARPKGRYVFGRFTLDPVTCSVARDGIRLPLTDRLFVTLLYLIEHHGRLIERDELLQAVWPGRSVEAGNLARAVSSLRMALRDREGTGELIVTVPGRGYRFAEHVLFAPDADDVEDRAEPEPLRREGDDVAPRPGLPAGRGAPQPSRLRRFSVPMAWTACAVCLILLLTVWQASGVSGSAPPFAPPARSIAVLPFVNLARDPTLDFISDGVSEDLINALGGIASLRVAASRSSFAFKGKPQNIGDMARVLNVRMVLEGSVQQDARAAHITAQLIDATTGYQIWSQAYDGDAGKVLSLERQIAGSVAKSLKIVLADEDITGLALGGTSNQQAFDAYLTGMASLRASRNNADPAAITAFSNAIRLDNAYALAYAHRARALAYRYASTVFPDTASQQETLRQARADAAMAVALAPSLGTGHAALADVIRFSLSNMAQGVAEIERALALSPNDIDVLLDYASMEVDFGHFAKAVTAADRAAALDPLTPLTYIHLASVLANSRHFDRAIAALDHARALNAGVPAADYGLYGFVKILTGEPDAAKRICAGKRNVYDLACLAVAEHVLGLQPEADAALAQLHTELGSSGAYTYAHIAAAWGRADEAQTWLRTAYAVKDPGLIFMKVDPALEPIHATPVFQDIEAKLGFPGQE